MSSCKLTLFGLYKYDENLFDNLTLPTGIDKDAIIADILQRGGEFEVMYPDVDFLKTNMTYFSTKWNRTFTKWLNALNEEYDPLYNYDRYEDIEEDTNSTSGADTLAKVSAYNSDTLRDNGKTEASGEYEGNTERHAHLYGNIGITTSQQMLEAELEIAKWNLYDHITDIFLSEFVIPVY